MNDAVRSILCVDDEKSITSALYRLLRRDGYGILTADSGPEGLEVLAKNDVQVVISDQRMPEMSGIEFLQIIKERYPDIIRIILTGYTEVDSITAAINKGHIYKFFLKPWNDQNLQLEIRNAFEQYDLIQTNKGLSQKVLEQNEALRTTNENLENLVQERTEALEIQNQALELSRAILEDLPIPIIGVGVDRDIVLINREASTFSDGKQNIMIGCPASRYLNEDINDAISNVLENNAGRKVRNHTVFGGTYDVNIVPLSAQYSGKGVVITLFRGKESQSPGGDGPVKSA